MFRMRPDKESNAIALTGLVMVVTFLLIYIVVITRDSSIRWTSLAVSTAGCLIVLWALVIQAWMARRG